MKYFLLPILSFLLSGCFSSTLNISDFKQIITTKENIPKICISNYKKEKPSVAVINFTNNSTFGTASLNSKNAGASAGISGFYIGATSHSNNVVRIVEPRLAKAFIPLIENMLLNTGGTKLFTRSDLNKVDTELQLQDSGLLDPKSVVEFGLTSGVKYLITGSIDYINHNFNNYSQHTGKLSNAVSRSENNSVRIAAAALTLASSFFDGTTVNTAITVKILDVATGQIVYSEQIKTNTKISSRKEPTYDQLIGAVKDCIIDALPILQSQFQEQFALKGYITKLRKNGNNIVAQINLGRDDKIKKDQVFVVQAMDVSTDPFTNIESCDLIDTNVKLVATQHIDKNKSWLKVDDAKNSNIKLLQLVKKIK